MKNEFQKNTPSGEKKQSILAKSLRRLVNLGLGEPLIKIGSHLLSVAAIALVVFTSRTFFLSSLNQPAAQKPASAAPTESFIEEPLALDIPIMDGVNRAAQLHTIIPSRPRNQITPYIVQEGDTIFGIAAKFGLQPQTILWGNYNILTDNPHSLKPGQELNILPVDGVYWEWLGGIPFGEWAKYYGVSAADIIQYPANNLDSNSVGDYENANIKVGTWLIIPNGKRDFVSWSAPLNVTRENPASARVLGAGACDAISGGAVGYGAFIYPSNKHFLSGFDFSPETNHNGLDFSGNVGEAVYASDAGVVVYAGWNEHGYGNMIMIDHGNGFQSLYAHLSALNVGCGQSVGQGELIGAIGSTGNSSGAHLHFEIMAGMKVNPWSYLPPP